MTGEDLNHTAVREHGGRPHQHGIVSEDGRRFFIKRISPVFTAQLLPAPIAAAMRIKDGFD